MEAFLLSVATQLAALLLYELIRAHLSCDLPIILWHAGVLQSIQKN